MLVGFRPHSSVLAGSEQHENLLPAYIPPPVSGAELALRKINHMFYAVTEPVGLATMVVGSLSFGLGRWATAKGLAQWAPRLWQGSSWLGHLTAGLGGLAAETATFANFPRALRSLHGEAVSWDPQTLLQDFFKTGLLFGMLRTSGLAGAVFLQNPLARTFGAGVASLVPSFAMGLGIYGNFWVEEKLGWRLRGSGEKRLWDSLETLAEFQVAGLAIHHFLGSGYSNLQDHFERKFREMQRSWQSLLPDFELGPRRALAQFGTIDISESLRWYTKGGDGEESEKLISEPPTSGVKGGQSERVRRPPSSEPPPPESIEFELLPGMKLDKDRYTVLELLVEGGMAEVWRLQDHHLDREVAGKIALPEYRRTLQHRFDAEFLLQAHLPKEWRVEIFDVLEVKKGLKMSIMEFVPGEDLDSLVNWLRDSFEKASQAYPIEKRIQIFADICEGTDATHQMGILHRDLKPENIKLAGGEKVLILDYGVATRIREMRNLRRPSSFPPSVDEAFEAHKTQEGKFIGTPGYIAPEVIQMAATKKDASESNYDPRQMDVFSLGAILFELVTGHHPLGEYAPGNPEQGEPALIPIRDSKGHTQILSHRVQDLQNGYIPPAFKNFHPSLDTPLFRQLEKVALKAMSPDLTVRYQSAQELRQAVLMVQPEITYDHLGALKAENQLIEDQLHQAEPNFRRSRRKNPHESLRLTQLEQRARFLKKTWREESEKLVSGLLTLVHRKDFPAAQHMIAKVSAALLSEGGSRLHPVRRETLMERIRENDVPYHHYFKPIMALALEGVPVQITVRPIHEPLKSIEGLRWTVIRLKPEKDSHGDETGNFVKESSLSLDPHGPKPVLKQGYYVFEMEAPGYAPMSVPISLSYEKIKYALGKEQKLFFDLEMVPADLVPSDMRIIHRTTGYIGHNFYHDGDTGSAHSFPMRTIEIPTQAVSVGPTSVGQYMEFIEDLLRQNHDRNNGRAFLARLQEIEALLPRTTVPVEARGIFKRALGGQEGTLYWKLKREQVFMGFGPTVRARLIDPTTHLDPFGESIHRDHPISAISPESGIVYAAWRSKRDGKNYEILDADTKNVIANSSFDIRFPWGNGPMTDTYVVSRGAFPDVSRATPQIIGTHPMGPEYYRDWSWYGIKDLIGNVREVTSTEGEPDHLCLSGGNIRMYLGANFSPASRYQAHRRSVVDSDGALRLRLLFPKRK